MGWQVCVAPQVWISRSRGTKSKGSQVWLIRKGGKSNGLDSMCINYLLNSSIPLSTHSFIQLVLNEHLILKSSSV